MQNLYFEEMMILSKSEKKARKVKFTKTINLILGENDVGKSTLMKSLYYTLGADTPQINNSRWKNSRAIYCLKFMINKTSFYIVRDGKYFGLFNSNKETINIATGIGGEDGIGKIINSYLNFDIELPRSHGDSMGAVNPAFYFLPYYIDQDEGWRTSWSSFSSLQMFKKYKQNMIDYHLGIKPQSYYDALSKTKGYENESLEYHKELSSLIRIINRYKKEKRQEILEIDPEKFKKEIDNLVVEFNRVYSMEQQRLRLLKNVRNKNIALQQEIDVLEVSIKELNSDYKYLENPDTPNEIDCPTCGTEFNNSISERFGILDDIDFSRNLIDQKKKDLILSKTKLRTQETEYNSLSTESKELDKLLQMKKETISLAQIIQSEAHKNAIKQIESNIKTLESRLNTYTEEIDKLLPSLKVDRKHTRKINKFYAARMKQYLNTLNVHVMDSKDYQTPHKLMKTNALGSDLPRTLIARYFALLNTMAKFNSFMVCPSVIDSPLQQEQDEKNSELIFSFIFKSLLDEQQLILATLANDNLLADEMNDDNINIIDLTEEYSLLQSDEYDSVLKAIDGMHKLTLTVN